LIDKVNFTEREIVILANTAARGNIRNEIKVGMQVKVIQKQDQRTGRLSDGVVHDILTNASVHPHGIKVRLQGGIVGRVKEILDKPRV
jgi:uncharacterized repeat protein (TIGR03833 family)